MNGPTPPNSGPGATTPQGSIMQPCPLQGQSTELKSIHVDIGWTFSGGVPAGNYELTLNGQTFTDALNNGQIRIDRKLNSIAGSGELKITVTNGPIFRANVELCMPGIQSAAGLAQRLTNLGFYAGTDGVFDGRGMWAIRAFKRVKMNNFTRNQTEAENNSATPTFLTAVQNAYGVHPNDSTTGGLTLGGVVSRPFTPCGIFGSRTCKRGSFETTGARDDTDPRGAGDNGTWEGASASGIEERIAGTFTIFLRAFDPAAGDSPIPNRVNLPQPIHMAQFVLFELGYWLVRGTGGWTTQSGAETRNEFTPDGGFGRYMQWAVREFQCHVKFANAAKEDVSSTEHRYLPRLFAVGDYVTSEKGVAMLLRWHIYRPGHLFYGPFPPSTSHPTGVQNRLRNILTTVIAAHPTATQARENAVLQQLSTVGGPLTNGHLATIHGWINVPQIGLTDYPGASYRLNLAYPTLNDTLNSFDFEAP